MHLHVYVLFNDAVNIAVHLA